MKQLSIIIDPKPVAVFCEVISYNDASLRKWHVHSVKQSLMVTHLSLSLSLSLSGKCLFLCKDLFVLVVY